MPMSLKLALRLSAGTILWRATFASDVEVGVHA
jgi:hypothetical protein